MSVLQSIQNAIVDELSQLTLFNQVSIHAAVNEKQPAKKKSFTTVEIMPPLPISASKNAANVLFNEVAVEIKITSQKYTAKHSDGILDICEYICKALHNKRIKPHCQNWKILIGAQKPITYHSESNTHSITIKFFIQSVKL